MPLKNVKKANSRKARGTEVAGESVRVMRTVAEGEAFRFYEAVDKPTGEVARSLPEFLDKVQRTVKPESLMFHLRRCDFQNWVEQVLGDSKLAEKLGEISVSDASDARKSLCRTVKNRIRELSESSMDVIVDVNRALVMSSS